MNIVGFIKDHFKQGLPFVAYRKPGAKSISAFFQETDRLFQTDNYSESGFVFAPFDNAFPSILIPESASEVVTEDLEYDLNPNFGLYEEFSENSKEDHINLVTKTIHEINTTRTRKIVISRKEKVALENADFINVFLKLLATYRRAMVYVWYHPRVGLWIGATPETLLKLNRQSFSTMSLAATRPYENTLNVSWNTKELEEQSLVTDFITNKIANVSKDHKTHERETVRAGNVVHLRTMITGAIEKGGEGLSRLIKALHPTPAVCGLPREAAKQFILREEGYERKYYTGFLGEIHMQNNSELFVNLRCMELVDNVAFLYVGGGITAESIPEEEWEETKLKTKTLKKVL
ncbi:chorismate-binding protein [Flavobacteriaceae bacterium S356]|uniref:isochorismate synthase n=1 Tax=Asprobacillus argus TaxID=3076534 RepID=A0ABU3LFJ7_9FLAO|nr:chorismate-binding protein [Flavobacteriaceae bacterium S356]